ncbi:unnamed protein product [Protopolystoma xenopodis]|uniref:Uncharacterized protein n=1 Tax=Protopolystoma xenopodis TaxID=117903 RepID=A0A3S5FEU5_9PLAT|nr:unnamed protein product [Protopolystoma xenopodis]
MVGALTHAGQAICRGVCPRGALMGICVFSCSSDRVYSPDWREAEWILVTRNTFVLESRSCLVRKHREDRMVNSETRT